MARAVLKKWCACGVLVWDAPHAQSLPRYEEQVICPNCGRDNSRPPPLAWRVSRFWRKVKKHARYFGWRATAGRLLKEPGFFTQVHSAEADQVGGSGSSAPAKSAV